jgi:hypothetical protein
LIPHATLLEWHEIVVHALHRAHVVASSIQLMSQIIEYHHSPHIAALQADSWDCCSPKVSAPPCSGTHRYGGISVLPLEVLYSYDQLFTILERDRKICIRDPPRLTVRPPRSRRHAERDVCLGRLVVRPSRESRIGINILIK